MKFLHILRVLFAIFLSGTIGWFSLFVFHFIKIMQQFEAFEATDADGEFVKLVHAMEDAIRNIDGGQAVFLAAGIAGVLLSEILKTRLFLFYAGATGALTAVFAAALLAADQFGGQCADGRGACHGRICRGWRLLDDRGAVRSARVTCLRPIAANRCRAGQNTQILWICVGNHFNEGNFNFIFYRISTFAWFAVYDNLGWWSQRWKPNHRAPGFPPN